MTPYELQRIRELWPYRSDSYARMPLTRLLADARRERERLRFRLKEAERVPIGAKVYELERPWPYSRRWFCRWLPVKVHGKLPDGRLIVGRHDSWASLHPIEHWAMRCPNETQRSA